MNLKNLPDGKLWDETKCLVADERRVSLAVLWHLREIEARRLFAERGFSSLYDYCTRELGYSEASAQRRIQSARLLSVLPEIAPQIETGELSLSVLAQVQTFFENEEVTDVEVKREIVKKLENQSTREAERSLLALASEPEKHRREKARPVSEGYTEIRFTADAEMMKELNELKGLLGESTWKATIRRGVKKALEQKRVKPPKEPSKQTKATVSVANSVSPPAPEVGERQDVRASSELQVSHEKRPELDSPAFVTMHKFEQTSAIAAKRSVSATRYVPTEVKRTVWKRDGGQCTFIDARTGRRCASRFALELDHLMPHALGGKQTVENLALKCRAHNLLAARNSFGVEKMAPFLSNGR